ncbi:MULTISPECIES: hypothetical protein [Pseudomonas]|uniref:Uncharacterized protein n=1 Tax=Pseudomonas putida TaxID=303 RepID=A0A7V8J200_PSEPU|nr:MULTISPECIES: hypothetical protein [Pseudomonas]KAF0251851.1 hypothetical protein GN299_26490 [Pseudomonas putida]MCE0960399.1 hypothetical protein [Pseudomonas putida]MCE0974187.1 hypothetical protein [Pseudomonas putida]MDD2117356.1 hypothetical protein [Pseudomonas putida]MDF3871558.1 hypothetical protein [Pseudomonas putida]
MSYTTSWDTITFPAPVRRHECWQPIKNLEALIKHARSFQPHSGDTQEDIHLREALDELANSLEEGASRSQQA